MTIRRASPGDIPEICRLLRQISEIHGKIRPDLFKKQGQKYSAAELETIISDYSRPVFLATDGGKVYGYIFCVFQSRKESGILKSVKTLYIDDLCIDSAIRGQGAGRLLMDYAFGFARAEKCYNVTLNVWSGNIAAEAFYESAGLKPQKVTLEKIL